MAKSPEPTHTAAPEPLSCTPKHLPGDLLSDAADMAHAENPLNRPNLDHIAHIIPKGMPTRNFIAVVTKKYWRTNGVRLGVGFLDNPPVELRAKILAHMNAWGKSCNVLFSESNTDPQVRISRAPGGFWSYIGTDILMIDKAQQTMNLEGFTMQTPDSEFYRVVRHETGHTLGCPHEHMRADVVALIDEAKAIAFYGATQGWTPDQVRAQVLTPLDPKSLWGTVSSDRQSIMCYQIPGSITKDGKPIPGGLDIDPIDYQFMGTVYPKPAALIPIVPASGAAAAHALVDDGDHPHAAATHLHRVHTCPDCIGVTLKTGDRLSVPPTATDAQVRMVLAALEQQA